MNAKKISSDDVPKEFLKWLLSMGCPADVVPSLDKMSQLCRGQYNMIWKSMMEHVQAKTIIRDKRMQVFVNDMHQCQKKSPFNQKTQSIVEPVQLTVWNQNIECRKNLLEIEAKIAQIRNELSILVNKVSSLLAKKTLIKTNVENVQRRAWLLQQVLSELEDKKKCLEEAQDIANSLCNIDKEQELEAKVEQCLLLLKKKMSPQNNNTSMMAVPEADSEELLSSLIKYRGDALWAILNKKRMAILSEFEVAVDKEKENVLKNLDTIETTVANTTLLHCSLGLQSMKNKEHIKRTQRHLAASIEALGSTLSPEACELLVVQCERASTKARIDALKELLHDMTSRRGLFQVPDDTATDEIRATTRQFTTIDKDIESTRNDITKYLAAQEATESKIHSVKNCLSAVFSAFHANNLLGDKFKGIQFNFPQESITTLHKYYSAIRQIEMSKHNLSMDFDASNTSAITDDERLFSNELRIYLQNFNLDKNRKILLKSGEKIWISETIQSSALRLQQVCLDDDVTPLLCPSVSIRSNLKRIINSVIEKEELKAILEGLKARNAPDIMLIDIKDKLEAEEKNRDRLKKENCRKYVHSSKN
ncbi:unnamed protein product [Leptosia nina]|uniref:HAUS augmin-like complex subunit 3 N-terminal domain-containing protein n=1 Tax=Leptosia nina TaxID=320188 RepID=A0AAV1J576_9NEOP